MKSYTDLEQSKKLAEILPIESADMWWAERYRGHTTKDYQFIVDDTPYYYLSLTKPSDGNYSLDTIKDIPCWSLAALLGVLPDYSLQSNPNGTVFVVSDIKKPIMSDDYDNPIDACYEMILKLKEENLL